MANNYCESSSKLRLKPEELEKAGLIVARVLGELEAEDEGISVVAVVEDDGVWFYHEESINPEHVVRIAQALLDELEIDEPFVFSWSYTCSKPRFDEFGGGACKIRRGRDPVWVDALGTAMEAP